MNLTTDNGALCVTTSRYQLIVRKDRPFADLKNPLGDNIASLFLYAAVHARSADDDTTRTGIWQAIENKREIVLENTAHSNVWDRKTVRLRCTPDRFTYEVEVEGLGEIVEVDYFGGYYSADLRWGSGYFWSGQNFDRGFNPEPIIAEV